MIYLLHLKIFCVFRKFSSLCLLSIDSSKKYIPLFLLSARTLALVRPSESHNINEPSETNCRFRQSISHRAICVGAYISTVRFAAFSHSFCVVCSVTLARCIRTSGGSISNRTRCENKAARERNESAERQIKTKDLLCGGGGGGRSCKLRACVSSYVYVGLE